MMTSQAVVHVPGSLAEALALRAAYPAALPLAGGTDVMVYLEESMAETAVVQQAAAVGVGVYPGASYHLERPAPPSILLGFSGLEEAEIEEGIRRLAGVLGG